MAERNATILLFDEMRGSAKPEFNFAFKRTDRFDENALKLT